MALCSAYFNDNLIKIHSNMLYESGPIYLADCDVKEFSRRDIDLFIKAILEIIELPSIKISESQWFDKNWIKEKRGKWLKALGVISLKELSKKYKSIEINKNKTGDIEIIPTKRDGKSYEHKEAKQISPKSFSDIVNAINTALQESE
jgi:hypothetical protein